MLTKAEMNEVIDKAILTFIAVQPCVPAPEQRLIADAVFELSNLKDSYPPKEVCRACKREGWAHDEFLNYWNGLCAQCQPPKETEVKKIELDIDT